MGIAETNIDWQLKSPPHRNSKKHISGELRRFWKRTCISFSSSDHRPVTKSSYQPGGTLTLVGNPWSSRTNTSADPTGMGRWTTATIQGRDNTKITVYTVYRVCHGTIATAGPNTAFSQLWHLADNRNLPNNDPRQLVLDNLSESIKQITAATSLVIVMMDANSTLSQKEGPLTRWLRQVHLIDPLTAKHGFEGQPRTFEQGSARIDYIFISPDLLEYVSRCGILPINDLIDSDHRAVYIDIDLGKFLKGQASASVTASIRGIQSGNPKAVERYQQLLEKSLDDNKIMGKMRALHTIHEHRPLTPSEIAEFLHLEQQITHAKLQAEKAVERTHGHLFFAQLPISKNSGTRGFWNYDTVPIKLKTGIASYHKHHIHCNPPMRKHDENTASPRKH
jgi:hypothetical protein